MRRRSAAALLHAALFTLVCVAVGIVVVLFGHSSSGPAPVQSPDVRTAAATGTAVCGDIVTQTWTAFGSPYVLCDTGAHVTGGNTLRIDASLGPVVVIGQTNRPLYVDTNATLMSAGVGGANTVTLTAADPTPDAWPGIYVSGGTLNLTGVEFDYTHAAGSGGTANLTNVDFKHAGCTAINVSSGSWTVNGGSIASDATSCTGGYPPPAAIASISGALDLENITITDTPGPAVGVESDFGRLPLKISGLHITNAGSSGWPAITISGPSWIPAAGEPSVILTNNTFTNSTSDEPVVVIRSERMAPSTDLAGNLAGGNVVNAVDLDGDWLTGRFSWVSPTAAFAASPASLGWYVGGRIQVMPGSTMSVPAGGVVKSAGSIEFDRSSLDATAGDAVFTSWRDNTVAAPLCVPSTDMVCTPASGDWEGLSGYDYYNDTAEGTLKLTGATIRYAGEAVSVATSHASGTPAPSLTLTGSTITHVRCGAVGVRSPMTITGTSFEQIGQVDGESTSPRSGFCTNTPGYNNDGGQAIYSSGRLVADHDTFTNVDREGVLGVIDTSFAASSADFTVSNSTFDTVGRRGFSAIQLGGSQLAAHDDVITNSSHGSSNDRFFPSVGAAAMTLSGFTGDPGSAVHAITGSNNAYDAILLDGANLAGDVTWPTATNSAVLHSLGWIGAQVRGTGPGTLHLPAGGAFATWGPVDLYGMNLDASAGGARFEPDPSLPTGCAETDQDRVEVVMASSCAMGVVPWRLQPGADGKSGWLSIVAATTAVGSIEQLSTPALSPAGRSLDIENTP